ncbi:hypothetical protein [Dyadobacter psychrotolerans]|uniref:Uncharacterized protein n=1 Tax=Dyadobacter psychrotolerans TaxID=2541721 RepID=A0A4R5DQ97_9BACT|nr:hypothetical protein [Dyadobacter psychrotolerans]TDE13175.1 hypothetical protein E0F88_19145 [Dyadobacter psychrotolerans]
MKDLIQSIKSAETMDQYEAASKVSLDYFSTATEEERESIKKVLIEKADQILHQAKEVRQKAGEIIAEFENKNVTIEVNGQKYPLTEWVTMKEYCRRFGLKNTMVVNNWISRKIIPKENILNISQLNNLKLIKAVPYKS